MRCEDLSQIPSYIASPAILQGEESDGSDQFVRYNATNSDSLVLLDPKTPRAKVNDYPAETNYNRAAGFWTSVDGTTSFTFRIPIAETQDFNLSFYTNSVDQGDSPLTSVFEYPEVFGRDVEFLVTDVDPVSGQPRRQHYRVSNNAPGVWVTFATTA